MPVQEAKKSKWLQEVEDDATRITERRFREQEEDRQYQASKVKDAQTDAKSSAKTEEGTK